MAIATPEAVGIPVYNPLGREIPTPAEIRTVALNTPLTIYDEDVDPKCVTIFIQNLQVDALKYAFGTECKDGQFNGVLNAGQVVDDGLGGNILIDIQKHGYKSISVFCAATAVRITVSKHLKNPALNQFL